MINVERLSKDVREVLRKDLASQWRGVYLYMKKIKDEIGQDRGLYVDDAGNEIGDVLEYCKELIEENTELLFEDYSKKVFPLSEDFMDYLDYMLTPDMPQAKMRFWNNVYVAVWLFWNYMHEVEEWENNDTFEGNLVLTRKMGEARKDEDEDSIYSKFGACWHWRGIHSKLNYKICRKIYEYIYITGRAFEAHGVRYIDMDVEVDFFVRIIKAVFLYIALKNERQRIKEKAFIVGVELDKIEEVTVSPQSKRSEEEDSLPFPENVTTEEDDSLPFPQSKKTEEKDSLPFHENEKTEEEGDINSMEDIKSKAKELLLEIFFYNNKENLEKFIGVCKGKNGIQVYQHYNMCKKNKSAKEYDKNEKTLLYNCLKDLGLISVKLKTFLNYT